MTSPPVPAPGVYYLTASLTIEVDAGDTVECTFNQGERSDQEIGPSADNTFSSMSLSGAASLSAGDTVSIVCLNVNANSNSQFGEGNLNAVLIGKSGGVVSSAARPGATHTAPRIMKIKKH